MYNMHITSPACAIPGVTLKFCTLRQKSLNEPLFGFLKNPQFLKYFE